MFEKPRSEEKGKKTFQFLGKKKVKKNLKSKMSKLIVNNKKSNQEKIQ